MLSISPFHHCGGQVWGLLNCHQRGAAMRVFEGYQHDAIMKSLETDQPSATVGFDVVLQRIVRDAVRRSGGIPFDVMCSGPGINVFEEFTALGCDVAIMYGQTETSNVSALTRPDDDEQHRRESNGFAFPGVDIRICDPESGQELAAGVPGEIRVRGWNQMLGYYRGRNQPLDGATDDHGFYRSGDYGWLDDEGRVYYRGRYAAMIKTGGENVAEAEVENVLVRVLHEVVQAAVVGVPDDDWGEAVVAFVETADDSPVRSADLRERCRGHMAKFKIPKHFIAVKAGEWPVTPTGKIVKGVLREQAEASYTASRQRLAPSDQT